VARIDRINIKLKAYDHNILDNSVREIVKNVQNTGAQIIGPIPLPTEKTIYTIQRSTFVDKKSREQFEMRVHKRLLEIHSPTPRTTEALKNLSLPSGVEVEIKT
jgi:small subunit ribosomal protein S10